MHPLGESIRLHESYLTAKESSGRDGGGRVLRCMDSMPFCSQFIRATYLCSMAQHWLPKGEAPYIRKGSFLVLLTRCLVTMGGKDYTPSIMQSKKQHPKYCFNLSCRPIEIISILAGNIAIRNSLADKSPADFGQVGIFIGDLVLQHIFLDPISNLVIIDCRSESAKEVQGLLWKQVQQDTHVLKGQSIILSNIQSASQGWKIQS